MIFEIIVICILKWLLLVMILCLNVIVEEMKIYKLKKSKKNESLLLSYFKLKVHN